jgi:hypothetical protein
MNYKTALKSAIEGNCVRLRRWEPPAHARWNDDLARFELVAPKGTVPLAAVLQEDAKESEEWELYLPPAPKMTLVEAAAKLMRNGGGRLRRRACGHVVTLTADSCAATDWEVMP